MMIPELEGAVAMVAYGLVKGPATLDELAARIDWDTSRENLIRTLTLLREKGFVAKGELKGTQTGGSRVKFYWLKDAGCRSLLETIDHYRIMENHVTASPQPNAPPVEDLIEDTSESDRPPRDRHPFPQELELLLRAAPPELSPPVRVILGTRLDARLACRALIEDFDRTNATLTVEGTSARLPASLAALVIRALGNRRNGPLFVRANGRAWTFGTLTCAFRDARNAAGLPLDLVLVGRHGNHKGNPRKPTTQR